MVVDDVEVQSSFADEQVSDDFDVIEEDLNELDVAEDVCSDSVDAILAHSENFENDSDEVEDESDELDAVEHSEDTNSDVCCEHKPDWDP